MVCLPSTKATQLVTRVVYVLLSYQAKIMIKILEKLETIPNTASLVTFLFYFIYMQYLIGLVNGSIIEELSQTKPKKKVVWRRKTNSFSTLKQQK